MKSIDLKTLLLGSSLLMGTFAFGGMAYAQDAQADDEDQTVQIVEEGEEDDAKPKDQIIVTGSRIKKDTFSSVAPLQVLSVEDKMDVGLISPVEILQQSESAAGTQIDSTFQGFVLDNGPGSSTINLRGFGASRTLVMVNGRRLGPAGVEGAPQSASINLIPNSLVERYELLLDGASSIYGSDAVAGVVNAILRKDFDGFEASLSGDIAEQGGTDYLVSGSWGKNVDRGMIAVGVEYDYQDEVTYADRDFLRGCETHVEIDQQGNRYRRDRFNEIRYDVWFDGFQAADGRGPNGECRSSGIAGRIIELGGIGFGSMYSIPGQTNIGIPGFIDQTFFGVPIDGNNDGIQDYGFQQFAINGNDLETSLFAEEEKVTVMAFGEYTLEGDANITPFFEALYVDFNSRADSGTPQLFPFVSASNPFNPCGVNGVDCAAGIDQVTTNPGFITRWGQYWADPDPNRDGSTDDARICARFGIPAPFCTPQLFGFGSFNRGPVSVLPVAAVDGDRDQFSVNIRQLRLAGGFKGDIPFLNNFKSFSNWSFETSLSYHRSDGDSSRPGIRGDRLNFALGNNASGIPCQRAPGEQVRQDVLDGCVPVNMFAPSLYPAGVVGDFATPAERNYLFDSRDVSTEIVQTIWNGYMTGNIAELPAGSLGVLIGAEYRLDSINTAPDDVAKDGLFFGFFSDEGVVGKKFTRELFAEIDIPIVADKPFFRELDFHASGRITDDEYYGTNYTYSGKMGWRPFDSLLLKATVGTSFRAPNLRENFLINTSGFTTVNDPCAVPEVAKVFDLNGNTVYDPNLDPRDPATLQRCALEGADPTTLGLNGSSFFSVEFSQTGTLDLNPETAKSYTFGFSFEQPWFDGFDLNLGATYYNIQITDTIVDNSNNLLFDCYIGTPTQNPGARDQACDNITRDGSGELDLIRATFTNRDSDDVAGVDINAEFVKEFNAFDTPMEFGARIRANHLIDRSVREIDAFGNEVSDTFDGEFGFPEWTATGTLFVDVDSKWRVLWETRYLGAVEQDADSIDPYSDVFDNLNTGTFSDTCGGAPVGGPICRDVGFADEYFTHTLAVRYNKDTWRIGVGVTNIFDKEPPEVDGSEVFSVSNVPIGAGYDLNGRSFFANIRKKF